ncbi:hypothetical protein [Sphingobacterium deserti]|uniref:Lipoprotein n=1 Tax=Sphingobacterium deserti TaxID=1229276 RepID=A0A0B8T4I8_9SPHI|nr:hypothetical protein [Sphingobacterium deserti]KGE14753.1 hypothetical protein DI53_1782 [Sphingobacterium deserti]
MNIRLLIHLLIILLGGFTSACSDDDEYIDQRNKEHLVKVVVYSNTPDIPVLVDGVGPGGESIYIKNYWEKEVVSKSYATRIVATCEERTVLITIEIYVDGKLRATADGNSYVAAFAEIKKDRRKY